MEPAIQTPAVAAAYPKLLPAMMATLLPGSTSAESDWPAVRRSL